LTRQSIDLRKNFLAKRMDARVTPAHDELAKQLKLAPMGLDPRIHVFAATKAWMAGTSPAMTTSDSIGSKHAVGRRAWRPAALEYVSC
jgi:hypothetical protein